jgi:quercetin dioxygenase-like cupin family protein
VTDEARLDRTEAGLLPQGDGWFVVNAREARWLDDGELGVYTPFAGEVRFPRIGINLAVLQPGQPSCMYHGEDEQEDFLVLAGECLLLVEGQERRLRAWDFVHCPPWTEPRADPWVPSRMTQASAARTAKRGGTGRP